MAYNISAFAGAGAQFLNNNGTPLAGGLLYVYTAGTTTPATTWTTNSGSVANTNPIVLDSGGRVPYGIWVNGGVNYKFILKTSAHVTIGTYDNIPAIDDPSVFNNLITVTGTNTLVGVSTPPYTAYVAGMTLSFIPANTNTGAVTLDVDGLGAKNIYAGSSTPLIGSELVAGRIVQIEYDGARFQLYQSSVSIPDGAITTAKLADSAVTTAKIADSNVTTAKINNAAVTAAKLGTTGTASTGTYLRGDMQWVDNTTDVQVFNSTGTWNKPTANQTMARIQVWGGGGGGSRYNGAAAAGGGGGGGYNELTVPLSYLAASLTATVGGGGAGATTTAAGATGGTSSVPLATAWQGLSTVAAYGGGGGDGLNDHGGGGGGQLSAGLITGVSGSPTGLGGVAGSTGVSPTAGFFHGGGGSTTGAAAAGANSMYGGGGGGGADYAGKSGGISLYGGAGGAGNVASSGAGTQPGGGGGSAYNANVNGGNGAAGRVIITCW